LSNDLRRTRSISFLVEALVGEWDVWMENNTLARRGGDGAIQAAAQSELSQKRRYEVMEEIDEHFDERTRKSE
jgi:hypothetical protein